jgi:hypothetical protein
MPIKYLSRKKAKQLLRLRKFTLGVLYVAFSLLFVYLSVNLTQLLPNVLLKYLSPLIIIIPIIYGIASKGKDLVKEINRFCIRFIIKRPFLLYSILILLTVSSTISVSRIIHEANLFEYKISNQTNNSVRVRILFANETDVFPVTPKSDLTKNYENKIITVQDITTASDPRTIYADDNDSTLYIITYDNIP